MSRIMLNQHLLPFKYATLPDGESLRKRKDSAMAPAMNDTGRGR